MTNPQPSALPPEAVRCPACGASNTGAFCHQCGTGLREIECPRCHQKSPAGNRFCGACGTPFTSRPADRPFLARYGGWILGASMGVVLVTLVLRKPAPAPAGPPAADDVAPTAPRTGTPPDLSKLTPRQRFDRLYQHVINAAQQGDQATVQQFTPMAVAAFGMLDKVDADARYHLAMLLLHVGDASGAKAQADSIHQADPNHLFSFVIDGAVGRWNKNDVARDAAYQAFRARYDNEIATKKPEYIEHQAMLAEVEKTAAGTPVPTRPAGTRR